jgi:hypothetical protein
VSGNGLREKDGRKERKELEFEANRMTYKDLQMRPRTDKSFCPLPFTLRSR